MIAEATIRAVAEGHGPGWYSICGLPVRSDVPLPIPTFSPREPTPAAWTIRLGDPAERLARPRWLRPDASTPERQVDSSPTDRNGMFFHHYQLGPDGTWLWWGSLATVRVSPDAREVAVYPEAGGDPRLLGLLLAGPLTAVVLSQLGYPLLHASAVVTPMGAVAFLGRKGQGKSTMAAAFLRRGAALLTDDMLLLRADEGVVRGVPGPAVMKVWDSTAKHTLGLEPIALPTVTATIEKKLLWLDDQSAMAHQPVPVRALYVLDRYAGVPDEGVTGRDLRGQQALAAVIAQAYGPLLHPTSIARLLPTYSRLVRQARVRVLRYPTGFEWQDPVYRQVMRELERA